MPAERWFGCRRREPARGPGNPRRLPTVCRPCVASLGWRPRLDQVPGAQAISSGVVDDGRVSFVAVQAGISVWTAAEGDQEW